MATIHSDTGGDKVLPATYVRMLIRQAWRVEMHLPWPGGYTKVSKRAALESLRYCGQKKPIPVRARLGIVTLG